MGAVITEKRTQQGQAERGFEPGSVGWTRAKVVRLVDEGAPFELELGGAIAPVDVEYETYGELSPNRDNVVLIEHALSGDAHVAGWDADAESTGRTWRQNKPGWWDSVVGPGKGIDTDRFFVVCVNVLGSCYGTTGPSSTNPATGRPYGMDFPMVTVNDWVRLQEKLLSQLGIEKIKAVIGGSLGGQQAIEWALLYPERVERIIVFAANPRLSTQGLAFNAVGRTCIKNDPNFRNGNYYDGEAPWAGLSAARMLAHITYLSDASMHDKFGRRLHGPDCRQCGFGVEYEVESYLDHQGKAFVERFDANSYLYITRAMDYYDPASSWGGGDLIAACRRLECRTMIVSFDSDWLYPPEQSREFARSLTMAGKAATYVNVPSRYGHDAFLVETAQVDFLLKNFLNHDDCNEGELLDGDTGNCVPAADAPRRWQDAIIEKEISDCASVLDLGCGKGELLAALVSNKGVRGQGVEMDPESAFECVGRGVPILQTDLDEGLSGISCRSFDYVVLEETLQTVRKPLALLKEMIRVGKRGIVSFPNFAHERVLRELADGGRMPVTESFPHKWYDTPNIHPFTLNDFLDLARIAGAVVVKVYVLAGGEVREMRDGDNLAAEEALVIVESL